MNRDAQELERLGPRLGDRAAAALDVGAVTERVVARLQAAGGPRRTQPLGRWMALAAALALVIGAGALTLGREPVPGAGRDGGLTAGIDDLSAAELTVVLDSLGTAAPTRLSGAGTLDDLDAEQLQTLLHLMEG